MKQKASRTIPFAIVLGSIVIAFAVYTVTPKTVATSPLHLNLLAPVGAADHILGNPAAPVKIIEYCDFESAYCKTLNATMHQIISDEGASGEVAWVYRELPMESLHPDALSAAEAAECAATAGGSGAFWSFADTLFANQPVDPSRYGTLAQQQANLPGEAFAQCYANASTTVLAHIESDRANALSMGAPGVPFSLLVVAGKPPQVMLGTYPYVAIKQLVADALAGTSR